MFQIVFHSDIFSYRSFNFLEISRLSEIHRQNNNMCAKETEKTTISRMLFVVHCCCCCCCYGNRSKLSSELRGEEDARRSKNSLSMFWQSSTCKKKNENVWNLFKSLSCLKLNLVQGMPCPSQYFEQIHFALLQKKIF